MNRRTFLQLSAGLPAAAALRPKTRHRTSPWGIERIGIQLYTVRSVLADDFEGTIRAVAGLGYQELEFAGYYDRNPEDIRALLDELDMTAPAGHIGIEALRGDLAGVINTFLAMGHRYVVCPYLDANERTLEHYRQHAALFNEVGVACSEAGLQFAYHNHEFEFVETEGIVPYDLLLAETDPELVWMELDLFWVEAAQVSSVDLFTRAPGRFPLCHIKDMGPDAAMVAVGEGDIDFASILAHSEHAGLRHYFVEHDHPEDPMQSIATSIAHLQSLEF
ncbi:MAG: sugar phosphate isomerase/epimerase [Bacteroidota bacterium]|nr:sugar phosphate isomerase/epimerase [Bacteroidota bacterium]